MKPRGAHHSSSGRRGKARRTGPSPCCHNNHVAVGSTTPHSSLSQSASTLSAWGYPKPHKANPQQQHCKQNQPTDIRVFTNNNLLSITSRAVVGVGEAARRTSEERLPFARFATALWFFFSYLSPFASPPGATSAHRPTPAWTTYRLQLNSGSTTGPEVSPNSKKTQQYPQNKTQHPNRHHSPF